jgi:hypothetical protein
MRFRHAGLFSNLTSAVLFIGALSASVAVAQSNSSRSQEVALKDPTPREPDMHLLLKDNQGAGTATQEAVEHRNAKRRELELWAADELVTLSQRLEAEIAKSKTGVAKADAQADAAKIEQLAKSLSAALKAN